MRTVTLPGSDVRDVGIIFLRHQALDVLENAIRNPGLPGVEPVPVLGSQFPQIRPRFFEAFALRE